MKIAYTQYLPGRCAKGMTDKEEMRKLISLIEEIDPENGTAEELRRRDNLSVCAMDNLVRQNRCRHLYVKSREFCEWLVSCVKHIEKTHLEMMLENLQTEAFVYHFPCSSGWESFLIKPLPKKDAEVGFVFMRYSRAATGERKNCAAKVHLRDEAIPFLGPTMSLILKFSIGMAMYTTCFPETVVPGVPEDLKHPSHHQHDDIVTVGVSPKVCLGGTHASPVAHFRTGHFRVLKSEFFMKKRFQSIFIAGLFVKGKASTVLSPEEVAA